MRTLLLVSTALALVACSDNPQPTAPPSSRHSIGSATTGAGFPNQALTQSSGKPVDQVGFTKTTVVTSPAKTVLAGASGGVIVTCPSGTVLVGGGYSALPGPYTTWPFVWASVPHKAGTEFDGWAVNVRNYQPNSEDVTVQAYAICAS